MKPKTIGAIIGGVIGLIITQSVFGFPIFFFPIPTGLSRLFLNIMLWPFFETLLEGILWPEVTFVGFILEVTSPIVMGAIEGWLLVFVIQKIKTKSA